jgi:hypothetical protein
MLTSKKPVAHLDTWVGRPSIRALGHPSGLTSLYCDGLFACFPVGLRAATGRRCAGSFAQSRSRFELFQHLYIEEGVGPEPVRLILLEPDGSEAYQFEIDVLQPRSENPPYNVTDPVTGVVLGQGDFFNEQVTHISHLPADSSSDERAGYLVVVNFEQPRVLLLKDTVLMQSIAAKNRKMFYRFLHQPQRQRQLYL